MVRPDREHAPAQAAQPNLSLLRMAAVQRLSGVAVLLVGLWLVIWLVIG